MNPEIAARLHQCDIQLVSEGQQVYMFARGNCVALVERTGTGLGSVGSTGIMTGRGLAFLMLRDDRAWLAAKGSEVEAAPAQIEEIQRFSSDLKSALG